jgi:hypothetical protein
VREQRHTLADLWQVADAEGNRAAGGPWPGGVRTDADLMRLQAQDAPSEPWSFTVLTDDASAEQGGNGPTQQATHDRQPAVPPCFALHGRWYRRDLHRGEGTTWRSFDWPPAVTDHRVKWCRFRSARVSRRPPSLWLPCGLHGRANEPSITWSPTRERGMAGRWVSLAGHGAALGSRTARGPGGVPPQVVRRAPTGGR